MTLGGFIEIGTIVVLSLVLGIVTAIEVPTRQSFTVEMVGREDLRQAIAFNAMLFNFTRTVGPALGGVIVAAIEDSDTPPELYRIGPDGARQPITELNKEFTLRNEKIKVQVVALTADKFRDQVQVSDAEVTAAMRSYYEDTHQLTEGAGAASLAALMQERDRMKGRRIGLILSGGNIDRYLDAGFPAPFLHVEHTGLCGGPVVDRLRSKEECDAIWCSIRWRIEGHRVCIVSRGSLLASC